MMAKTNVAIIGSGFGMYGLLSAFNMVKGCRVVSICGQDRQTMEKYWKGKPPGKIYTDWKKMLEKERPDVVAIAVVPKYQYQIAKYALEHGIAVFAEKPLTTSVATSLELCKLAKKHKLPNMVDFMFPEIPEWIEAKKLIESGAIGKVVAMNVKWDFLSYDLKNNIVSWKTDVKQGGGALSFFFSHVFYYLEHFMGEIESLECKTETSKKSKNHGETLVDVTAKFKNGVFGKARLDIDCAGPQHHRIEFVGEKGNMILQSTSQGFVDDFTLTLKNEEGLQNIKPADSFDLLPKILEDSRVRPVSMILQRFIDWHNNGIASKPNFEDGLRVQKLIDKARKSSLNFPADGRSGRASLARIWERKKSFTTVNVALIGKGYWGSKLEEYIKKNPHMKLVTVCDATSDLGKEVYRNPDIEAVFVATPDKTHYRIVKDILMHKKHVMCEKPLALAKKECLELEALAEKQRVVLCVDYTHTFSHALHFAQALIEKGDLGKMQSIQMRMKQLGPFGRENVYWLSASHMLAVLDMFIPLKKLAFCTKDLLVHNKKVETGAVYFNSNALNGEIFVSLNDPRKEREVIIYGDDGMIVYNPLSAKSLQLIKYTRVSEVMAQPSVTYTFFKFNETRNLQYTVEYFYNVIRKNTESNIARAVLVTEILEHLNHKK